MDGTIEFFAVGTPKGQPRPRAFARNFGGKWQARIFEAGTAEAWKSQVTIAAQAHIPAEPIEGPIRVDLTFVFERPKNHFGSGKNSTRLKEGAPKYHTSKPDRDNLDKAVLDALTTLGFWRDDAQVVGGELWKEYATAGRSSGVNVRISRVYAFKADVYERQLDAAIGGGR